MLKTIPLASGKRIDPFDVKIEQLNVIDIATHLSRKCRFAGGTLNYYSVAQHSVLASIAAQNIMIASEAYQNIFAHDGDPFEQSKAVYQMWRKAVKVQLHDGGEYIFPDIPRPIAKHPCLAGLDEHINKVQSLIYQKWDCGKMEDSFVLKIDNKMLETEKTFAIKPCDEWLAEKDTDEVPFTEDELPMEYRVFWSLEEARSQFIARFKEIWWSFMTARQNYANEKKKVKKSDI